MFAWDCTLYKCTFIESTVLFTFTLHARKLILAIKSDKNNSDIKSYSRENFNGNRAVYNEISPYFALSIDSVLWRFRRETVLQQIINHGMTVQKIGRSQEWRWNILRKHTKNLFAGEKYTIPWL